MTERENAAAEFWAEEVREGQALREEQEREAMLQRAIFNAFPHAMERAHELQRTMSRPCRELPQAGRVP